MYTMDMAMLNEDVTHGSSIGNTFSRLPKDLQEKIISKLKTRGKSEEEIKNITSHISLLYILNSNGREKQYSIEGMDIVDGMIRHQLELYDKERDERILASENIVEAYRNACSLQFDKAKKDIDEYTELAKKGLAAPGAMNTYNVEYGNLIKLYGSMDASLSKLKGEYDLTDADCKKAIIENAYCMSDDPQQIRDIINTRIQYNNTMVQTLKAMIQENYQILGLDEQTARFLSEDLEGSDQSMRQEAISLVKAHLSDNRDKFKKGDYYDLRPVGGGCLFYTEDSLGVITKDTNFDRMAQYAFNYDAVVIAHGSNEISSKSGEEELDRVIERITDLSTSVNEEIEELAKAEMTISKDVVSPFNNIKAAVRGDQLNKEEEKLKSANDNLKSIKAKLVEMTKKAEAAAKAGDDETVDKIMDEFKRVKAEMNNQISKLNSALKEVNAGTKDTSDEGKLAQIYKQVVRIQLKQMDDQNDILDRWNEYLREHKSETFWGVQPIKTLHGGPYTDMNDVVRQLIKEGFKKIYILSCNPGEHELADDILKVAKGKDVNIRHSTNSTFSESANDTSFNKVLSILDETATDLNILSESYSCYENVSDTEVLTEGALKKVWDTLVAWIRKIIGVVINAFIKIVKLFEAAIDKIIEFFEKRKRKGKFVKKLKTGVVTPDKVERIEVDSYEQLKKECIEACERLAKLLQKYKDESLKGMQEAEKYADQQAKKAVNESVGEFDALVNMLW